MIVCLIEMTTGDVDSFEEVGAEGYFIKNINTYIFYYYYFY